MTNDLPKIKEQETAIINENIGSIRKM